MDNNFKSGRNTTAITNPKTKSQNTNANTKAPGKNGMSAPSKSAKPADKTAKSGFGRNASSSESQSKSLIKTLSGGQKSGAASAGKKSATGSASGASKSQGMSMSKSSSKSSASMEASSEICKLKDFDIAADVLGGQKALLKLYGTALCETDCPNLRNLINTQLSEVAVDQFDTFSYMNQRGMYPTEQAPSNKVKQAVTQFNQKATFKNKK